MSNLNLLYDLNPSTNQPIREWAFKIEKFSPILGQKLKFQVNLYKDRISRSLSSETFFCSQHFRMNVMHYKTHFSVVLTHTDDTVPALQLGRAGGEEKTRIVLVEVRIRAEEVERETPEVKESKTELKLGRLKINTTFPTVSQDLRSSWQI